jgi:hypothetical protein
MMITGHNSSRVRGVSNNPSSPSIIILHNVKTKADGKKAGRGLEKCILTGRSRRRRRRGEEEEERRQQQLKLIKILNYTLNTTIYHYKRRQYFGCVTEPSSGLYRTLTV